MKYKAIAILGPTATGKTEIASTIAQKIDSEIINLDSVQIYKMLDIGSAKPREKVIIKHHLIDIFEPNEKVDMKKVIDMATDIGLEVANRGKIPIFCGGTGLYFKALFYGVFDGPSRNEEIRQKLKKIKEEKGVKFLFEELKNIDPETAEKISENDYIRIERALEVYYTTGQKISKLQKSYKHDPQFEFIKIGLILERKELYRRIEERINDMIEDGLIEEVKNVLKIYPESQVINSAIGYKEVKDFLENKIDRDTMIYLIKRNTRRFAKRQITLFKPIRDINWFSPYEKEKIIDFVIEKIKN